MIKTLTNTIKKFDIKIKNIMMKGLYFSLLVTLFGTLFLSLYISFGNSISLYYIGIKIVTLGFSFSASFLACAFAIDKIKKDLT